jgi:hypothetical protein
VLLVFIISVNIRFFTRVDGWYRRTKLKDYMEAVGITDARFVLLTPGLFTKEWEATARDETDLWMRTDRVVAVKRRREIDGVCLNWRGQQKLIWLVRQRRSIWTTRI